MSNDLNSNTAPVSHTESSKPSNVPAAAATPSAAPAVQPTGGNKKERFNKKSGGGFGGAQRAKL